ncbi:A-factor-processing enzyme [Monosporozyma unispora]|nr:Insulinase (Peptidase M16) [Kazachstania unispora]
MSNYKILETDFIKPDLDDRSYRYIQLPNNLKALIINDPTTDKAAAAIDVNIGAFEDPEQLPGLAHFCEHLLFMGSKKFPDENEYSSFLSKHGGSSNAYTGAQNTNYYFEINYEHLYGALDRFSGFFTGPLFNKESTDKEINAVDSENKKNLQNDLWRFYQLDKSLTNLNHPYHKFSTGNLMTLGENPKAAGLNIRDELLNFYNKSYSANLMKLCILGREDLDTLSNWAMDLFKDVKTIDRELPEYDAKILEPQHLQKIIQVKPVKELRKLEISFMVPDCDQHWKSQPPHFLSHLIGHEGSGSLLAHLKELGYANELSAGGHTVSKDNAFFSIDIDLTKNGLDNYTTVIYNVFQYIEMLKNELPKDWIFTELQEISNACFKFKQKGNPSNTVSTLAKALEKEYIPVNHILATNLMTENEPDMVVQYVNSMTMENSRITLISKDIETDSKEKWYETAYKVVGYSSNLKSGIANAGLNDNLRLPRPNEFIATNFNVNKPTDLDSITPLEEPLLMKDDKINKIWYKKDDRFWQPRGYIYLSLKLPNTQTSLLNSMLSTLYVQLVNDSLKDLQYDASCASSHVSFAKTNQGLDLTIYGFNDKLYTILQEFLYGIKHFTPNETRFNIFKDKTIQNLQNLMFEVPYSQVSPVYNAVINERSWIIEDKLNVVKRLTFEQLAKFIPTMFDGLYSEILIHGNIKSDEVKDIENIVELIFKGKESTDSQLSNKRLRSYLIPKGKTYRYENILKDKKNVNSCIQHVTQIDIYNEELSAKSGLFAQMVHEPCFDTLRTKEQLGYVVFSSSLNNHGTSNIRILVQSEHTTPYLEWRIDEFYKSFGETLKKMNDDDFIKHKDALCKSLLQKYKNMNEESNRYAAAIYLGDYNFTHRQRKADLVSKLTKEEIIEFFETYIMGKEASKVIIHLQSQVNGENIDESKLDTTNYPTGELIEDIGEFKSKLLAAPVRQPVKTFRLFEGED